MNQPIQYLFGPFSFEPAGGRLSKHGYRLKLQRKAAVLLACLLERPGQIVSRSEIEKHLWPDGTHVDFELGVRVALKRLRDALGDSSDQPIYIETIRGEGYRFIAPLTVTDTAAAPTPDLAAAAVSEQRRLRRPWIAIAAVVLLIAGGWISWRVLRPKPLLSSSGWILITSFDNRSGQTMLDGSVEFALQRELSNSQFVKVTPRQRVEDALRLMRQPADSRIDLALGRQICLRDGEIRALVAGRIDKLGTTYVLSAEVVNPVNGATVATVTEEDPADTQLAAAVRRLSNRVREALGEQAQAVQQSNERLAKVTTPSLHALQLYTQAEPMIGWHGIESNRSAAQLLEQALREDANFASAHVMLAHAYTFLGRHDDAAPEFHRAFELADTTSDRERYFILGSYYGSQRVDQPQKAVEAYETLLRIYPDHYWAAENLAQLYMFRLHEFGKVTDLRVRLADLRPNDLSANLVAAWSVMMRQIGFKARMKGPLRLQVDWSDADAKPARRYLERAIALRNAEGSNEPGTGFEGSPRFLSAYLYWLEGRIEQARNELREAERLGKSISPVDAGMFDLTIGNVHEAEERFGAQPGNGYVMQALAAYDRGDLAAVRSHLRSTQDDLPGWGADVAAVLMIHSGMTAEAESIRRHLAELQKNPRGPSRPPDQLHVVEGELALAMHDTSKGVALLEPMVGKTFPSAVVASEDLAEFYRGQGRQADAIRVLEKASTPFCDVNFAAPLRMRLQIQLAQLFRETGRVQDAQKIEAELSRLLAYADPDHPIVRQLAALRKPPETLASK